MRRISDPVTQRLIELTPTLPPAQVTLRANALWRVRVNAGWRHATPPDLKRCSIRRVPRLVQGTVLLAI